MTLIICFGFVPADRLLPSFLPSLIFLLHPVPPSHPLLGCRKQEAMGRPTRRIGGGAGERGVAAMPGTALKVGGSLRLCGNSKLLMADPTRSDAGHF